MENIPIFPEPEIPVKTEIPRTIDNNDVEKKVSLGIAIVSTLAIWLYIILYFSDVKISKLGFIKKLKSSIIVPILFVTIAAWTSYGIESSLDLNDQESKNNLYDHRVNEKFVYSFTGLILALLSLASYTRTDKTDSVVGYFGGIFVTVAIIGVLTYFSNYFCKDVFGETLTADKYSASIIIFVYFLFFMLMTGLVNGKNKGLFGFLTLLCFIGSVAFIVFAVQGDTTYYNVFELDSNGANIPSDYYKCTPLYRSEQTIEWKTDEVKINFDVNLNYLNSDKTIVVCGDEDNISWKIVYLKDTESFRLDYKDVPSLTIPITKDIIELPLSSTEAPIPSTETRAPLSIKERLSSVNITMQVRTHKDLNKNSGTILFYHDNINDQSLDTQSVYMENMLPPTSWNTLLGTPNYDLVKNFLYCDKLNEVDFKSMNSTVKFVFMLLFTILGLIFVLSIIHPKVRVGLFGSEFPNIFNVPGNYAKVMQ